MSFESEMREILRPLSYTLLAETINGRYFPERTYDVVPGISGTFLEWRADINEIHGAVDFQYNEWAWVDRQWAIGNTDMLWGNGPVNQSERPVYSPVTGDVLGVTQGYNGVVIESVIDKSLHYVAHNDSVVSNLGFVVAGTSQIGTEGQTSPAPVPPHVHYAVYLPDGNGWNATDVTVDPVKYWDKGLNLDCDGETTFEEGKSTKLTVTLNTPHKGPDLWLRMTFQDERRKIYVSPSTPKDGLGNVIAGASESDGTQVYYIRLPETENAATWATGQSVTVELHVWSPEDDDDQQDENAKLKIEAGYARNGEMPTNENWTAYSAALIPSLNRQIHVKDNDKEPDEPGPNLPDQSPPGRDPLILDLNADGIQTTGLRIQFDQDANGFAELTAWVEADDGFLAFDRNGNGLIDNGSELFGVGTSLPNGQKASNGFDALTPYDTNADGKIDASDAVFSDLQVWQDNNQDGHTDPGELHTLSEYNITAIHLASTITNTPDGQGNTQTRQGTVEHGDGTTSDIGEYRLNADRGDTVATDPIPVPDDIAALPNVIGNGNVYDLHQAMARDTSGALKALVESFIASNNPTERQELLHQIFYQWTGVSDVIPSSRGTRMDARKIAALEQYYGRSYTASSAGLTLQLEMLYHGTEEILYARLMGQSQLKDLVDAIGYEHTTDYQYDENGLITDAVMTTHIDWNAVGRNTQCYGVQGSWHGRHVAEHQCRRSP